MTTVLFKLFNANLINKTYNRIESLFSREITSGKMIPEIDGLRFISILLVFIYHLCGYVVVKKLPSYANLDEIDRFIIAFCSKGHFGVQIFFAISGFILALPRAIKYRDGEPQTSLKSYFKRRITRLEPPYLLNLSILALLFWAVGKASIGTIGQHYIASAFYLHNTIYASGSLINSVAWSLEVEIQFYILVPLLSYLFIISKHGLRMILIWSSILMLVIYQSYFTLGPILQLSIVNHLQYFLVGFLIADDYVYRNVDKRENRTEGILVWDCIGCLAAVSMYVSWCHPSITRWLFPISLYLLFRSVFLGKVLSRLLSSLWITVIGGMCYTIYLYHYLIISSVGRLSFPAMTRNSLKLDLLIQGSVLGASVLAGSAVLYLLIEKPCMRRNWPRDLIAWMRNLGGAIREGV